MARSRPRVYGVERLYEVELSGCGGPCVCSPVREPAGGVVAGEAVAVGVEQRPDDRHDTLRSVSSIVTEGSF